VTEHIRIGTVAGFRLGVHWSVLVILWLFTWSLASTLSDSAPGHSVPTYWIAGAVGATVLLASLLAHELTHAVVARRAGVPVSDVTLWLFGGVTRFGGEAQTAETEFRIAVSGPMTSLALAGVFAALAVAFRQLGVANIAVGVAWWLSGINVLLGLFNLLPGAPLDGGRVLSAYLWRRHGDKVRGEIGATRGGRIVGYALIALGLYEFVVASIVTGVWTVFIGWFLLSAARSEERRVVARQSLSGVRVVDAMTARPHTAPGGISVEDFIQSYVLGDRHSSYPVEDPGGAVVGLITLTQLRQVAPHARGSILVREAAIPMDQIVTVAPHDPLTSLLERLASSGSSRALVMDRGQLVGIVTASDISRLIDVHTLAVPIRADRVL
jgi:Zn-dependent protease/predicted transcriptional regulator